MSDVDTRSIVFSLIAVLSLTVLALLAALFIPFNVDESATIQHLSGEAEIITPGEPAVTAAKQGTLDINQTFDLMPGGEAQIVFDLVEGRAVLNGPASLTLVESYRRATVLGHATDGREYTLTLEQTQGSVRYFFANTTPPLEDMNMIIRLPTGNYTPDSPCWRIDIAPSGETNIESIVCSG